MEFKALPSHLKYVFLEGEDEKLVIISSSLTKLEEEKLLKLLKANKEAVRWHISDLKGISPSYCMHNINLEEDYKPVT